MRQQNREKVMKLVEQFKSDLSAKTQAEIGNAVFEKLALMINEVIQEERKATADMLEVLVKTLRKEIDTPELAM